MLRTFAPKTFIVVGMRGTVYSVEPATKCSPRIRDRQLAGCDDRDVHQQAGDTRAVTATGSTKAAPVTETVPVGVAVAGASGITVTVRVAASPLAAATDVTRSTPPERSPWAPRGSDAAACIPDVARVAPTS